MAGTIKGIIVEIGGDTSGLQNALKNVNSATSSLTKELKGVNSLLKLDPTNTELVSQKQEILAQNIQETSDKLKLLKQTQEQADEAIANGTKISDKNYRNLQREIINTENKLKELQTQASKWTTAGKAIEEYGNKIQSLGKKIDSIGNKLTAGLSLPILAIGIAGVQSAATQEAAMQQVEKIYGDAADTVKDFAENTALSFNMSTSDAYKYAQIYGNLIQSITDDEEENAKYTQELLEASSIIASATGRTMEDVMDRIRSGLLGNTEAIEDLGVNVNVAMIESTDSFKKFAGDKSWRQLDFQTQQQIRLFAILEQTSKKYGDEVNKNTSSDIQRLTARFKNLTSQLNKKLLPIADKLIDKAEDFLKELEDLDDEQIDNIINIGLMVAATGPLVKILGTTTKIIGGVTKGVGLFSQAIAVATNKTTSNITSVNTLAKAFTALTSPVGLLTVGFAGVTTAAILYEKHQQELLGNSYETKKAIDEEVEARNALLIAQENNINKSLSEIGRTEELYNELKTITDENGKIKQGYENRANYIVNQLSEALGIEIELNNGVVESYKEIQKEIDKTILKKKAESILSGQEEAYNNALGKRAEAYETLNQLETDYQELLKEYGPNTYDTRAQTAMTSLRNQLTKQRELIDGYNEDIAKYDQNYSLLIENTTESLNELIRNNEVGLTGLTDDTYTEITTQISYYSQLVQDYKKLKEEQLRLGNEYNAEAYQTQEESNQKQLEQLGKQLAEITTINNLNEPLIKESWKKIADNSSETFFNIISEMPEDLQEELLKIAGVLNTDISVPDAAEKTGQKINDNFITYVNKSKGKEATEDYVEGAQKGLNNKKGTLWTSLFNIGKTANQNFRDGLGDGSPSILAEKALIDYFKGADIGAEKQGKKSLKRIGNIGTKFNESFTDNLINSNLDAFDLKQGKISNNIINSTRTIFTTPQIVFNVQELDEAKLQQCFNYVNRKFGSQY